VEIGVQHIIQELDFLYVVPMIPVLLIYIAAQLLSVNKYKALRDVVYGYGGK
jgi:hypothetical protein